MPEEMGGNKYDSRLAEIKMDEIKGVFVKLDYSQDERMNQNLSEETAAKDINKYVSNYKSISDTHHGITFVQIWYGDEESNIINSVSF